MRESSQAASDVAGMILPVLLERAGLAIEHAIIGTATVNAGGIVGGLTLSRLVDRRQPYAILGAAYALATVFVAGIGAVERSGTVAELMLIIFLVRFFVIGTQFCINALAANFYPTRLRSTGVCWALGIGRIGSVVSPVVGGFILSFGSDWGQIFLVAAVPAGIAAIAVIQLGRCGETGASDLNHNQSQMLAVFETIPAQQRTQDHIERRA